MKRSEFLEKSGFTCIANHETKELHRVANLDPGMTGVYIALEYTKTIS
jgi:hypothetical protein